MILIIKGRVVYGGSTNGPLLVREARIPARCFIAPLCLGLDKLDPILEKLVALSIVTREKCRGSLKAELFAAKMALILGYRNELLRFLRKTVKVVLTRAYVFANGKRGSRKS